MKFYDEDDGVWYTECPECGYGRANLDKSECCMCGATV